jgi:predicted dehydrogenase
VSRDAVSHRVAVLGVAHIHVPDYLGVVRERADATVIAVWDEDLARARDVAARVGAPVAADPHSALTAATVAVVCAETAAHESLVAAALRVGLPLFVEKPLGIDTARSVALADRVKAAGIRLGTGFFLRHVPAVERLRALLADGLLGPLTGMHASFSHDGAIRGWFDGVQAWMGNAARAGYGGFGDLALHLIDLLSFVYPQGGCMTVRGAVLGSTALGGIDTHGTALLTYADGVPVTVTAGWTTAPGGLHITVTGTAGTAAVHNGILICADREGSRVLIDDEAPSAARGFAAFLDRSDHPDAAHRCVVAAGIVEAAYAMARTGGASPDDSVDDQGP